MKEKLLEIGKIVSTQGLRGEVRVEPWCDAPEFLCSFDTLYLYDGTPVKIRSARVQKNMCILGLDEILSVEEANELRGTVLYMNRDEVQLEEGTYFIQDLLGLSVEDADSGQCYGKIQDVFQTGANDVYVVENEKRRLLIPAIPDVVVKTDLKAGKMLIRPLEGLLDDAD